MDIFIVIFVLKVLGVSPWWMSVFDTPHQHI